MSKASLITAVIAAVLVCFTQVRASEVYCASSTLYIIDDAEAKVIGSIPIGKWIYNITISEDGKYAYLGASNGVNIMNIKERKIEGLLTDKPGFVVKIDPQGDRILVLSNDRTVHPDGTVEPMPSRVMLHDASNNALERTIELDRIVFDIVYVPERDRLYCLDIIESELLVIQFTSGAEIETIHLGDFGFDYKEQVQGFLWRMIRDRKGEKIYIPQGGNDAGLLILDTSTNNVRRLALDHEAKWRGGVLSPDGKKLYLNAVRRLSVIDLGMEAELAWKPLDVPYQEIAIDATGKKLYMSNPIYDTGGSLAIFDAVTLEPIERVVLPDASPYAVAASR